MRTIGVVTVGRSDYGILVPILRRIQHDPELELYLFVGGTHLSSEFGRTVRAIEADGFPIESRIRMDLSSDAPEGITRSMGSGMRGFGRAFVSSRPDLLLVTGDRFEMFSAAAASVPLNLPLAHLHGGEISEGAMDDRFRHAITKLSHLHFAATGEAKNRILRMGEEPWRVTVSGAPSLDNLHSMPLLDPRDLEARFGLRLKEPPLLVTYHPVTLEWEQTDVQIQDLLQALGRADLPVVFTQTNADTSGRTIQRRIREFVKSNPSRAQIANNLGTQGYFSLMAAAAAMVGNSSSGFVEAPSFGLPVVNVGKRQQGRLRAANVIDVECGEEAIADGIRRAIAPEFRASLKGLKNPYGEGKASEIIVRGLKEVELGQRLIIKRFIPWSDASSWAGAVTPASSSTASV
ncbi:MAG: UDP-N-acetylglucosamine 2-epimerase (hydrolyzing) [Candidatus Omnitrophica bacterium]|nr:UDP-N-acetylglucosamine 2-epimerase (hydrolyzing) [Candidatus Omnitrophota bacterium]